MNVEIRNAVTAAIISAVILSVGGWIINQLTAGSLVRFYGAVSYNEYQALEKTLASFERGTIRKQLPLEPGQTARGESLDFRAEDGFCAITALRGGWGGAPSKVEVQVQDGVWTYSFGPATTNLWATISCFGYGGFRANPDPAESGR